MKYGFYKLALCTPELRLGATEYNARQIVRCALEAAKGGAELAVFGKDALTGATCGSMLGYGELQAGVESALKELCGVKNIALAVGAPLLIHGRSVSCAALVCGGRLVAVVPETETGADSVRIAGGLVPCLKNAIFRDSGSGLGFGITLGEDTDRAAPDAAALYGRGASLILNLAASPALVEGLTLKNCKAAVAGDKYACVYAYASTGMGESAGENVPGGYKIVCEGFTTLACEEGDRSEIVYAEADAGGMAAQRRLKGDGFDVRDAIEVNVSGESAELTREIARLPFVPAASEFDRLWDIMGRGVYARMKQVKTEKLILGLSGGLDSAVALLTAHKAFIKYGLPPKNIVAVVMRGPGSGGRTNTNALLLAKALGVSAEQIPIGEAVEKHLRDIGHTGKEDVTYENAQARERAQILLDLANKYGALQLGTGDLSEIALGWSTFGGDQTAHYNPNAGLAKTLIRALVRNFVLTNKNEAAAEVLNDILLTPVSPELKKNQETESVLGPYELHDFFLYHLIGRGDDVEKTLFLAARAYPEFGRAFIKATLKTFIERFFTNQFKRTASCDGIQLSPFDLTGKRIYSEFSSELWLKALEKI